MVLFSRFLSQSPAFLDNFPSLDLQWPTHQKHLEQKIVSLPKIIQNPYQSQIRIPVEAGRRERAEDAGSFWGYRHLSGTEQRPASDTDGYGSLGSGPEVRFAENRSSEKMGFCCDGRQCPLPSQIKSFQTFRIADTYCCH